MSAFCDLCSRDPDTGELFCTSLGEWVERCPNFPDGYPWDAEREAGEEKDYENINTDCDRRRPVEHPHAVAVRVAQGMHRK